MKRLPPVAARAYVACAALNLTAAGLAWASGKVELVPPNVFCVVLCAVCAWSAFRARGAE